MHLELMRDVFLSAVQEGFEISESQLQRFSAVIHRDETRVHFSVRIDHCLLFVHKEVQMEALQCTFRATCQSFKCQK